MNKDKQFLEVGQCWSHTYRSASETTNHVFIAFVISPFHGLKYSLASNSTMFVLPLQTLTAYRLPYSTSTIELRFPHTPTSMPGIRATPLLWRTHHIPAPFVLSTGKSVICECPKRFRLDVISHRYVVGNCSPDSRRRRRRLAPPCQPPPSGSDASKHNTETARTASGTESTHS